MEPEQTYRFKAELWLFPTDKAPWHFVTVPVEISHAIRFHAGRSRGFGSIRVRARVGATNWATSLFPDAKSGCYFLPMKADVRQAEKLGTGDSVTVTLDIA